MNLNGLPEYLSESLGVPCERADVWTNAFKTNLVVPPITKRYSYGYATAIGLALKTLFKYDKSNSYNRQNAVIKEYLASGVVSIPVYHECGSCRHYSAFSTSLCAGIYSRLTFMPSQHYKLPSE